MVAWTKGEIVVWLNLGDLGEDIACNVGYSYYPGTPMESEYPGDPQDVEILSLDLESFGIRLNPKYLTEDALEYVENEIISYEEKIR